MSEVMGGSKTSWAEQLVDYYSQGYSDAEVAAALKITVRDFNRQLTDNETFAKLVEYGRTLSTAFWESLARKNVNNKTFNSPLYAFYMKNKFGWADKVETTNTSENTNISMDALKQEILRKVRDLSDANTPELAAAQEVLKPVAANG